MPFNGSGGFTPLAPPQFPAVAGTTITASYFNAVLNDVMTGLGQCVTRSGQSPWSANLPANGFKLTGLGAGTIAGDALSWGQAITVTTVTASGDIGVGGNFSVAGSSTLTGIVGVGLAPVATIALAVRSGVAETIRMDSTLASGGLMSFLRNSGTPYGYIGNAAPILAAGVNTDLALRAEGNLCFSANGGTELLRLQTTGNLLFAATTAVLALTPTAGAMCLAAAPTLVDNTARIELTGTTNAAPRQASIRGTPIIFTAAAASTEFARFTAAGFLGVGLTVPADSAAYGGIVLDVAGPVYARQNGTLTKYMSIGASAGAAYLEANGAGVDMNFIVGGVLRATIATSTGGMTLGNLLNLNAGSGNLLMGGAITRFESGTFAVATGSFTASTAHTGPRKPDIIRAVLRCLTAELGYAIGDEVEVCNSGNGQSIPMMFANATTVGFAYNHSAGNMTILHKTTQVLTAITNANWNIVFYCLWL